MAARINRQHDARARQRIQAAHLVKRLQAFALGQDDPQSGKPVEMTRTQVASALALLKKVLPDLVAVELAGSGQAAGFLIFGEREAASSAEWMAQHARVGQGGDDKDIPNG